jgi:hypothetical protein
VAQPLPVIDHRALARAVVPVREAGGPVEGGLVDGPSRRQPGEPQDARVTNDRFANAGHLDPRVVEVHQDHNRSSRPPPPDMLDVRRRRRRGLDDILESRDVFTLGEDVAVLVAFWRGDVAVCSRVFIMGEDVAVCSRVFIMGEDVAVLVASLREDVAVMAFSAVMFMLKRCAKGISST